MIKIQNLLKLSVASRLVFKTVANFSRFQDGNREPSSAPGITGINQKPHPLFIGSSRVCVELPTVQDAFWSIPLHAQVNLHALISKHACLMIFKTMYMILINASHQIINLT